MRLRFRSAERTHAGCVRQVNEDAALSRDDARLWLVADGMGGHANGQWASQTVARELARVDMNVPAAARGPALVAALGAANAAIVSAGRAAGAQMGTTAVMIHIDGANLLCLWVGDSRAYRFRRGGLSQLSRDHSVVQELIDRGALAPEDAESHPMAHVLSRAVGTEADLRADAVSDAVQAGDCYLLCSDGLTKVVPEDVIARLLRLPSPNAVAERLVAETLARGAPDNVTVVVITAEEATEVTGLGA